MLFNQLVPFQCQQCHELEWGCDMFLMLAYASRKIKREIGIAVEIFSFRYIFVCFSRFIERFCVLPNIAITLI